MTEVAFHFNAPDRLGYACRLLRKAVASDARVVVTGEAPLLAELDLALWTFAPLEFIGHGRVGIAEDGLISKSQVVLADTAADAPHHQVLVNLGPVVPQGFERFERLIEVVTAEAPDRQRARERWRHYADRGYAIVRHDLAGREGR